MALFDFLKRKKEIEKSREKSRSEDRGSSIASGQPEKKSEKVLAVPTKSRILDSKAIGTKEVKKAKEDKPVIRGKKVKGFSYSVIKEPHISEKGTNLGQINKYVFKINGSANKHDVKKSIEGIHGVTVLSVNIIKIPGKKRRIGRTEGFKKGYKKAIVTLKEGQKIELF